MHGTFIDALLGTRPKDDLPGGVCRTCGHGAVAGERLNSDGSCPIRDAVILEGVRLRTKTMAASNGAVLARSPWRVGWQN